MIENVEFPPKINSAWCRSSLSSVWVLFTLAMKGNVGGCKLKPLAEVTSNKWAFFNSYSNSFNDCIIFSEPYKHHLIKNVQLTLSNTEQKEEGYLAMELMWSCGGSFHHHPTNVNTYTSLTISSLSESTNLSIIHHITHFKVNTFS